MRITKPPLPYGRGSIAAAHRSCRGGTPAAENAEDEDKNNLCDSQRFPRRLSASASDFLRFSLPTVRPNHLLRIPQRLGSQLLPTQHPPDLARPRRRIQLLQHRDRPAARLLLLHPIMVIRETGDL